MRRTIVACLILLTAALAAAQSAPLLKYRVLPDLPPEKGVVLLNQAADQGYRLLFVGRMAVMRLDAAPPDTYRYLARPHEALSKTFLNQLNQQGALGYGWVHGTDFLEKAPHPRNYEYAMVEGISAKAREQSHNSLLAQGFVPVASFNAIPIFMHELGAPPPDIHERPFRTPNAVREKKLMEQITDLAARGYRYRRPAASIKGGGRSVSMEQCDASCGGPFEYRDVEVNQPDQLERDLNALGEQGFRLVKASLAWPPHLAERGANREQRFVYRVAEVPTAAAAEEFLNTGDRDGFDPVQFADHISWNVHIYLVLEKATASAAP